MHENYDLEQLMELVEKRQFRRLREELSQMNVVDIADFLDELEVEQEILVFPAAAQRAGGRGVYLSGGQRGPRKADRGPE